MGNNVTKKRKLKINVNISGDATLPVPSNSKHIASPSASSTITARLSSKATPIPESPLYHPTYSAFPSTTPITPRLEHKTTDHLSAINNGVTGTHISYKICKIAVAFWRKHIQNIPEKQRLEIACSIFFNVLSTHKEIKEIMMKNANKTNKTMEEMSLKYLNMIEWLIHQLMRNNIDLYTLLEHSGVLHQNMGVKIHHFAAMLRSMHEALSYYFPKKYSIEVKYAMDEIFSLCAQIMSGEELKYSQHLNNINKSFKKENDIEFLQNLKSCLKSCIGREYLYKYFRQTFCDEIAVFLQLLGKFKHQVTCVQRFMIARDLVRTCIVPEANFSLNISFDCRNQALMAMEELESLFIGKQEVIIHDDFFEEVEIETRKLILDNHWISFGHNIRALHSKSFGF